MGTLRTAIIKCLDDHSATPDLIHELQTIIDEKGTEACELILHILTHLKIDGAESLKCWNEIVLHHEHLSNLMGRPVNLRTTICDYFCSIHQILTNPKVVEIYIFEKALKDSKNDPLTGLLNRNSFDLELAREMERAKRYDSQLSILFLDIDDFKNINDTYGHQVGDTVLQHVAGIIHSEKRIVDIAARFGGDEMVLLLPRTQQNQAVQLGERILRRLELEQIPVKDKTVSITLSGGQASFPGDAQTVIDLVNHADLALYRSKSSGKNKISKFSPDKRRFVRLNLQSEVKVKELGFINSQTLKARSKNLSIGGVLFENPLAINLGTSIQLCIPIEETKPLLVIGRVVRTEAKPNGMYDIGVSLSLAELDKKIKNRITKWLSLQDAVA